MAELAHLINAVAWPLVVVWAIIVFREPLSKFISEVKSVKVSGASLEREVQAEISRTTAEHPPPDTRSDGPSDAELRGARVIATIAAGGDLDFIRRQAKELGAEYEQTRASMRPGSERTRAMEAVVTKMRAIGRIVFPIRFEMSESSSPGDRLTAIACLQVQTDFDMIGWLVGRVRAEQPFVSYHAMVALRLALAAPNSQDHLPEFEDAMNKILAMEQEGVFARDSARERLVENIRSELRSKA